MKMPNLRNGSKGDRGFEPGLGSLDCESGVLPLSYRAPRGLCSANWLGPSLGYGSMIKLIVFKLRIFFLKIVTLTGNTYNIIFSGCNVI